VEEIPPEVKEDVFDIKANNKTPLELIKEAIKGSF